MRCQAGIQKLLQSRQVCIFDFDGVLVDSLDIKAQAFAELFAAYGSAVQAHVVAYHEANKGVSRFEKLRYYHTVFLNESVDESFLERRATEFSRLVVDRVVAADEIAGASSFLNTCRDRHSCFVVSATPEDEINDIVDRRGWRQYFGAVYGSPNNKLTNIQRLLKEFSLQADDCVFFGDARADRDAARAAGIAFVAVNYTDDDPQTDLITVSLEI